MNRRKILIVDDDQSVCQVIKIALEDVYDVVVATSGIRALNYLAHSRVDLVVLDINMPGMNGIETLEAIYKRHPETFVIMISSDASRENMQKATSLGAYGFICKPFELDNIRNYIDSSLNVRKKNSVHEKDPVLPHGSSVKRI